MYVHEQYLSSVFLFYFKCYFCTLGTIASHTQLFVPKNVLHVQS